MRRGPDTKQAARSAAWYARNRERVLAEWRARPAEEKAQIAAVQRARNAAMPPVVYVWMAPDGVADYVGRGTRHRAAKRHVRDGRRDWWTPDHLLLTMTCDSEWHAMEMEGRWGARYQPRYNREGYRHAGLT